MLKKLLLPVLLVSCLCSCVPQKKDYMIKFEELIHTTVYPTAHDFVYYQFETDKELHNVYYDAHFVAMLENHSYAFAWNTVRKEIVDIRKCF